MTAYLEEVPVEQREALIRLRDLCRAILTGFEETMEYDLPSYKRNGEVEVGFGKGAIRYSKPRRIDFQVAESMLRDTKKSTGPVC
jgi:hypothetical protein